MVFCIVVLHYKTDLDTIQCVESIQALHQDVKVVIVDNASNNGSIEKVEARFADDASVHIIKNDKNLGFSAGNNVGYRYAREVLHSDYIAVSNNDIIIESADLVEVVEQLYHEKKFYVMGPDIESLVDHGHQNPVSPTSENVSAINKEIRRYKMLLLLSRLGGYDFLKKIKGEAKSVHSNTDWKHERLGTQIHGAFLIFSPAFVKRECVAFTPETFLYTEEALLYQRCKRKNYLVMYSPRIKVLHKEDSSTNSLFQANRQKREFVFQHLIHSLTIYRNFLKQTDDHG